MESVYLKKTLKLAYRDASFLKELDSKTAAMYDCIKVARSKVEEVKWCYDEAKNETADKPFEDFESTLRQKMEANFPGLDYWKILADVTMYTDKYDAHCDTRNCYKQRLDGLEIAIEYFGDHGDARFDCKDNNCYAVNSEMFSIISGDKACKGNCGCLRWRSYVDNIDAQEKRFAVNTI